MKNKSTPEPELSRPLRIEKISPNGVEQIVQANERERKALSERFDLIGIMQLEANLKVMPECAGLNYAVSGSLTADVLQSCVVTLEPLSAHIEQTINVHYAAPDFVASGDAERSVDEDDMEPIDNGVIDLGELVAQHLGLALDPYPRKSGLPVLEKTYGEKPLEQNPFARLVVNNDDKKG